MKASRSAGSTTAPQLIILSTSFVHEAFPNRCCTMMPESWHSKHAVFILACSGPGGKSADCGHNTATHVSDRNKVSNTLSLDMDLHPVNHVDEISAGVPLHRIRLHAALGIDSSLLIYRCIPCGQFFVAPGLCCLTVRLNPTPAYLSRSSSLLCKEESHALHLATDGAL
jgi:hypothetical protein